MSASEFVEWQAFERVDGPIGAQRSDILAALMSYFGALPNIEESARHDLTLESFLPIFDQEEMAKDLAPWEVDGFDGRFDD